MQDNDDECWKGPPEPPAMNAIANDPSCQGILALALRDALSEIQQEAQQEEQQSSAATAASTTGNDREKDDRDNGTNSDDDDSTIRRNVVMDDISIHHILQAMGKAVADTQQEQWKRSKEASSAASASDDSQAQAPPAALVRGRLDHYNRRNGKWRIVLDKATFRRRMNLERRRRKSEKPSLWDVSRERYKPKAAAATTGTGVAESGGQNKKPSVVQPNGITLQILAYNDLE